ncbi:BREX-3 system phosphatase PglZ [Gracilibacillus xinjiangensis]|uniref:BREX-3 system phosphatase PglZ n=1 Tax=Gracilibacillus xinjiangensis TaxID=1193282 RepID=A0ABV8WSF9_9BACI
MSSWREEILYIFEKPLSPLYIVSDPDGLLNDEKVLTVFQEKNIAVVDIQDTISFRYIFETKYRTVLKNREVSLIVRTDKDNLNSIPYDLLRTGSKHNIGLSSIFPKLSYPVIKKLNITDIDALYTVYGQYQGSTSNNDTIDFLLKKVYKVHLNTIENTTDFMKFLLSYHYRGKHIPKDFVLYVIKEINQIEELTSIPVKQLVQSSRFFYSYLQAEWHDYINQLRKEQDVIKDPISSNFYYHAVHPFSDPDVRRLLNDLFLENKLQPIKGFNKEELPIWVRPGIVVDECADRVEKFNHFLEKLNEELNNTSTYKTWTSIAKLYGELSYLYHQIANELNEDMHQRFNDLSHTMNQNFEAWMFEKYATLYNIPYYPNPVMVDRIPHYLEGVQRDKLALIVLDGMNFTQWSQIKQSLFKHEFQVEESGVFAWVPTLTSVSRQAIFSGKMPMMFSDSIHTTNKEEKLWKTFWEDRGIPKQNVSYQRALGQGTFEINQIEALTNKNITVAGLVVDTVDALTHGAIQGHKGMAAELDVWLQNGYLLNLLNGLSEAGFSIFITSDHGNTECQGIGRISDGVLVQSKGERVRIYNDKTIRDERANEYSLLKWPNIGLPEGMNILLANEDKAFIPNGEQAVSHGSISLKEVIVPFVEVIPINKQ